MTMPYLCPKCTSNRTRFNIIDQHARPVKMDSVTGLIVEDYPDNVISDPFHMKYTGARYKVQCGMCGLLEDEVMFIKAAKRK